MAQHRNRRIGLAVLAAGLATFAVLYAPQPVLPLLAAEFRLGPGEVSAVVSAATLSLALAVLPMAALSEVTGRKPMMLASVVAAVLIGLALPLAPDFGSLIALRAVQGVAIAGLPGVAMAYMAEEIGLAGLGAVMGLYVAGNTTGGMSGRLLAGVLGDVVDWRFGLFAVAVLAALCAVAMALLMPASRAQARRTSLLAGLRGATRDSGLYGPYAVAFLGMAATVAVYNVISFRLIAEPFRLAPGLAALVFLGYLFGGVASAIAGRMADRLGKPPVLLAALGTAVVGMLMTLPDKLFLVLPGIALLSAGFFAAHAVASSWIGARAAPGARAQASGVYLLAYYLGSSMGASVAGWVYGAGGWTPVALVDCAWLVVAGLAVVRVRAAGRSAPPSVPAPASPARAG
ncbi:MFS transporter [Allokutzneria albata]|uniref:MFS transporter, YNFM family, putative membrane transport protein n=1 Tax=Allokutzneria albata TaxID=211114 RepID=A0A1G9YKU3_ALLAB|nr:MFS transporter [Allokutzneria albata]SDN09091.1 MFS transporter, YNFM family, putative membrane transport protein [Allokutzneria albata]